MTRCRCGFKAYKDVFRYKPSSAITADRSVCPRPSFHRLRQRGWPIANRLSIHTHHGFITTAALILRLLALARARAHGCERARATLKTSTHARSHSLCARSHAIALCARSRAATARKGARLRLRARVRLSALVCTRDCKSANVMNLSASCTSIVYREFWRADARFVIWS